MPPIHMNWLKDSHDILINGKELIVICKVWYPIKIKVKDEKKGEGQTEKRVRKRKEETCAYKNIKP